MRALWLLLMLLVATSAGCDPTPVHDTPIDDPDAGPRPGLGAIRPRLKPAMFARVGRLTSPGCAPTNEPGEGPFVASDTITIGNCAKDTDCTAPGARCVLAQEYGGRGGTGCVADECTTDDDCAATDAGTGTSAVCVCGAGLGRTNICIRGGNCRMDADCSEGAVCLEEDTVPDSPGPPLHGRFFCTTPGDTCVPGTMACGWGCLYDRDHFRCF